MQFFYQNHQSPALIVFFAGWGCDYNQFKNLKDEKDVLILFDYQDLSLNFDFGKYKDIYVIAYSAGVWVASVTGDIIPNVREKIAVCGNPYLFDERLGISSENMKVFQNITLDNYLDFRRKYMVFFEQEYEKYNQLESLRTIESCEKELKSLQKLYIDNMDKIDPVFDKAIVAENDLIFNLAAQRDFYKGKLNVVKNAKHHIFFRYNCFEDLLNI